MVHRKRLIVLQILLLVTFLSACQHNTSNVPQVTIQQKAQVTIDNVVSGFRAVQQVEQIAFKGGLIPADEDAVFRQAVTKFTAVMRVANDAALKATDAASATQAVSIAVGAVNDLIQNGVAGIKNPTRKAEIQAAVSVLQTTLAAFGGK